MRTISFPRWALVLLVLSGLGVVPLPAVADTLVVSLETDEQRLTPLVVDELAERSVVARDAAPGEILAGVVYGSAVDEEAASRFVDLTDQVLATRYMTMGDFDDGDVALLTEWAAYIRDNPYVFSLRPDLARVAVGIAVPAAAEGLARPEDAEALSAVSQTVVDHLGHMAEGLDDDTRSLWNALRASAELRTLTVVTRSGRTDCETHFNGAAAPWVDGSISIPATAGGLQLLCPDGTSSLVRRIEADQSTVALDLVVDGMFAPQSGRFELPDGVAPPSLLRIGLALGAAADEAEVILVRRVAGDREGTGRVELTRVVVAEEQYWVARAPLEEAESAEDPIARALDHVLQLQTVGPLVRWDPHGAGWEEFDFGDDVPVIEWQTAQEGRSGATLLAWGGGTFAVGAVALAMGFAFRSGWANTRDEIAGCDDECIVSGEIVDLREQLDRQNGRSVGFFWTGVALMTTGAALAATSIGRMGRERNTDEDAVQVGGFFDGRAGGLWIQGEF